MAEKKTELSDADIYELYGSLEYPIEKYLVAVNTNEPYDRLRFHLDMSDKIVENVLGKMGVTYDRRIGDNFEPNDKSSYDMYHECRQCVHDTIAKLITDRLDESIGFPLEDKVCLDRMDTYVGRFFKQIVSVMTLIEDKIFIITEKYKETVNEHS